MEAVRNTIGVPVAPKTPAKLNVQVLSTAFRHIQVSQEECVKLRESVP